MTKQEFAFKLLTFFMPYPLSRKLPGLLRRLLVGPLAETPEKWAAPALSVLSHVTDDIVSYSNNLINSLDQITPSDLQVELSSTLENAIVTAENSVAALAPIVRTLADFTLDDIISAFGEVITGFDYFTRAVDDLASELPPVIIPKFPQYSPPLPPLYVGPPVPGPTGPSTYPPSVGSALKTWFLDEFEILDPAVWTDYSSGTGDCSIVNEQLKMYSNAINDYAYLATAEDPTIPETFDWSFSFCFVSGTGLCLITCYTGVHNFWIIFAPPNILRFRRKGLAGYIYIDVGNYMGLTHTWRFLYNGTTCTIYRGSTLIASDLTIYERTIYKGERRLELRDVATINLDDYKFLYPL